MFSCSTVILALVIFECFRLSLYPFKIPIIRLSVGSLLFLLILKGFLIPSLLFTRSKVAICFLTCTSSISKGASVRRLTFCRGAVTCCVCFRQPRESQPKHARRSPRQSNECMSREALEPANSSLYVTSLTAFIHLTAALRMKMRMEKIRMITRM